MFKKSKNKSFNYIPRFSGEKSSDNAGQTLSNSDFIQNKSINYKKNRTPKKTLPISVLLLLLVLLLIVIFILDSYIN